MDLLDEELQHINQATHSGNEDDMSAVVRRLGDRAFTAVEVWKLLWPKVAEKPSVRDLAMNRMFRRETWSREPFARAIADILVANPVIAVSVKHIMEGDAIDVGERDADVTAKKDGEKLAVPRTRRLIADILAERYDDFDVITESHMSTIYRCRKGERTVVFKSLDPTQFDDKTRQRLRREIRLLRDLDHPHIICVYDHQDDEEPYWYEMEYAPIGDLKSVLSSLRGDIPRIHRIFCAVCDGLKYLHSGPKPVVHRDLKPGNILMFSDDHPKISDAGLARLVDRETATITTGSSDQWGTREYMAPEQMLDFANADVRSDVYSLGIVLFEMFVGHTRPHWVDLSKAVPTPYDAVVARMLETQAENRYPSIDDLLADLAARLSNQSANPGERPDDGVPARSATEVDPSAQQAENALDINAVRETLSRIWPDVHRLEHEPYDVLLNDLKKAGVTSQGQLEDLIQHHRDDVLRRAAREAEYLRGLIERYGLDAEGKLTYEKNGRKITKLNITPRMRGRVDAGLHYGHVALSFTALQFESGERSPDDPLE